MSKNADFKSFGEILGAVQNLHILAGNKIPVSRFVPLFENNKFKLEKLTLVDALLKSITELIDNVIDIHEKGNWKFNKLYFKWLTHNNKTIGFSIQDNDVGIPIENKTKLEDEVCVRAFTEFNAGTNATENTVKINWNKITIDDLKKSSKGRHGVGAVLSTLTSKQSLIVNRDTNGNEIKILTDMQPSINLKKVHNGLLDGRTFVIPMKLQKEKCNKSLHGVTFLVHPDFNLFGLQELDEMHRRYIESYTKLQLFSYPKLNVFIDGKNFKSFNNNMLINGFSNNKAKLFDFNVMQIVFHDNHDIGTIMTSNGLINNPDRKTNNYINVVENHIVDKIRKFIKLNESDKVATFAKPLTIKEAFPFYLLIKQHAYIRYTNQEKTMIGDTINDVNQFLKIIKFDAQAIVNELVKSKLFTMWLDDIKKLFEKKETETKIKNANVKLKQMNSSIIDDFDKFVKGRSNKRLYICEGDSALNAIAPHLDRQEDSALALTGKPDNVMRVKNGLLGLKMTEDGVFRNHNIQRLLSVLKVNLNEVGNSRGKFHYDELIIATDADDDGRSIVVLLVVLLCEIYPKYINNGKIKILYTPTWVKYDNNDNVIDTSYNKVPPTNDYEHIKGLGLITIELWEHLKINNKLNHLHVPLKLNEKQYDLFCEVLREDTEIRKDMIKKVYEYIVK